MGRGRWAIVGALLLAACGGPPAPGPPVPTPGNAPLPPALAPPQPPAEAAVGPAMAMAPAAPAPAAQAVAPSAAELPVAMPAGAIYACVVASASSERQVSAIELAPRVSALCARNPEMGPCQYAREACRRGGGRVFAADGQEITRATEAEYDKRVLRIRLKSG
jgi:hypothetical protein